MDEGGTAELPHGPNRVSTSGLPIVRAPQFKQWFAKLPALNIPQRIQTLAALHPAPGWTG